MSKTLNISEDVHSLLNTYRLELSAARNKEQTFSNTIAYLIKRDSENIPKEVSV